jgi:nucleotide-binding universal stress UspA family protein
MTLFESILVPLDGSEHSLRALDVAVQIAKVFRAKLTLIHVYSATVRPIILPEPATLIPSGVPAITAEEVTKVIEAARGAGERILADGRQRAEACQLKAKTLLKEGQTTQEIIRTAKEEKSDLIVIGARGVSKIREILLGSVSDGVTRNAPCPVLVVK